MIDVETGANPGGWPDDRAELKTVRGRLSSLGVAVALLLLGGLAIVAFGPAPGPGRAPIRGEFRRVGLPIKILAFSPDGRGLTLVLGREDGTLKVRGSASGVPHELPVGADRMTGGAALSPDGKTLALGGQAPGVSLWDVASEEARAALESGPSPVSELAFSPDGKTLAAGSIDGSVRLWDVAAGVEVDGFPIAGHAREVRGMAFSPDGKTLATGSLDGSVKLWDVGTGRPSDSVAGEGRMVRSLAFSPDGKTLAFGLGASGKGDKGMIVLRDLADRRERARIGGHSSFAVLAFSPDGRALAGGGADRDVRLWDAQTGRELAQIACHDGFIDAIAFSPDGRKIAAAGHDPYVGLFEIGPALEKVNRRHL